MTAAYSVDLRKKIVGSYEEENTSYSKVAKNFGVSVINVKRYVEIMIDARQKNLRLQH
jgi:transposase